MNLRAQIVCVLAALLTVAGSTAAVPAEGHNMDAIHLPSPRLDSAFSVERALKQRRSVRDFSGAALTLAETGQLLWAAQGVTSPEGLRTAPSAGALYPLEIILVAGNVTGLPPGVYAYAPAGHTLKALAAGDRRAGLAQAALSQQWMLDAPAVIAFCADERLATRKYGGKGVSYIYTEVGHAAQNVFLQAQALGLGAAVVGAFDDARAAALLQLPREQRPLYLMPVGRSSVR